MRKSEIRIIPKLCPPCPPCVWKWGVMSPQVLWWRRPCPYGMWVPVAVRRVANCYTPFTLLFLLYVMGNLTRRLAFLSDFNAFIPGIGDVRQTVDLRERFSDGTLRQFRWQIIFVHSRDPTLAPKLGLKYPKNKNWKAISPKRFELETCNLMCR